MNQIEQSLIASTKTISRTTQWPVYTAFIELQYAPYMEGSHLYVSGIKYHVSVVFTT